ncbi:MAG: TrkA C-terminal domain-containing protein [Chloroflexota bacterium]|nr:TrkA C-terminal domain-containing protein [Chloroflexota bacterium]
MFAMISLLAILSLSMLVVRIGAVALMMTGLSRDAAAFQALSAFSGAGFTTGESELAVATPERRKIIALLIRAGNVGAITVVTSLILSFVGSEQEAPERLLIIVLALTGLVALSRSRWFNQLLTPLIQRGLSRSTTLVLRDYAALLHLREDYRVAEVEVRPGSWLEGRQLRTLDLPAEGLLILGIVQPSGEYVGAPPADFVFSRGDTVVIYGREQRLEDIARRPSRDAGAHEDATAEHTAEVEAKTETQPDQRAHRSSQRRS